LFWVVLSLEVNPPSLVGTIVALVPVDVSVLRVRVSVNIEASLADISDVSSGSIEPSHHLVWVGSSVVSNNSGVVVGHHVSLTVLNGDDESLVGSRSNGLGSPVEAPPLFVAVRIVILDSQSVLLSTNVFMPEQSSLGVHSSLDLESSSISNWVSWEVS